MADETVSAVTAAVIPDLSVASVALEDMMLDGEMLGLMARR